MEAIGIPRGLAGLTFAVSVAVRYSRVTAAEFEAAAHPIGHTATPIHKNY
jgi:hypothetical protein